MTRSPNHVFKVIWCRWRNAWVVVSERVTGGRARSARAMTLSLTSLLLLAGAGLLVPARAAPAPGQLPTQGRVSAGSASIASAGTTMTVTQTSSRAALDWGTFNIGSRATVHFVQPGTGSIALNRVLSSNPSQIYGHLDANGQVYLLNPHGVYFARGAAVDVGGIVATSANMSDAAFMAGSTTFARNGANGAVTNLGNITSRLGGYIALLAPTVRNQGVLVAQAGTVAMAGGETVRLNFGANSSLQSLTITPSQIATLIDNADAVSAPGGLVILSTQAMNQLAGDVINSGQIEATGAATQGGRIVLEAGSNGRVTNKGLLSVASSGANGGCVSVSAYNVQLGATSSIDASGATGGGTVLVGGDWQGGSALPQAHSTVMKAGASIDAAATQSGNGGEVVLWSSLQGKGSTIAAGSIVAQGAGSTGVGGRIEASGAHVNLSGLGVNAAGAGGSGLWLIDPYDYTITASGAAQIASALNNGTSVTVTTSVDNTAQGATGISAGNITVASAIDWYGAANLTLSAASNIAIRANLAASAPGASFTAQANGAIFTSDGVQIQTNDGSIVLWTNANGGSAGGIELGNGNTFNSANGSTTQQIGGGAIVMGGGAVANAAGLPTGAAENAVGFGISVGAQSSGGSATALTLVSGGGDIVMCGASSANSAISVFNSYAIDAGSGNVTINGTSTGPSGGWSIGTALGFNSSVASRIAGGNVTISGASSNGGYALWVGDGWAGSIVPTVTATNNIVLAGNLGSGGGSGSATALYLPALNITSTTGNISVIGNSTGAGNGTCVVSSLVANAGGSIEIDGESATGHYGVYLPTGVLNATNALTINGSSATGDAIHFVNNVDLQAQDANLTLIGNTACGSGIFYSVGNASSLLGSVNLFGNSSNGYGIDLASNVAISSTVGSVTLIGHDAASGYNGLYDAGGNITTGAGSITLVGSAAGAWGINLNAPTSTLASTSGNITLDGTSSSTSWAIYGPMRSISTVSGAISLIGTGNVNVDSNLSAGGGAGALLVKSSGYISVANNIRLQTNNGALTLWSNANGGAAGGIDLGNGDVLNSGNGSTTQSSGGGAITLGGGTASLNGVPTGAAESNSTSIWAIGLGPGSGSAVVTVDSAGGDIRFDGQYDPTSGTPLNAAVSLNGNAQIQAFNGNITLIGTSTAASNGLELGAYSGSTDAISASGNITLIGSALGGGTGILAVNQRGTGTVEACGTGSITMTGSATGGGDGVNLSGNNFTVAAQLGDINLCGTTPCASTHALDFWNVLDAAGNITLNAGGSVLLGYGRVGQLAGSVVAASTTNITLIGQTISFNNGVLLNTNSGNVTLQFGLINLYAALTIATHGAISLLPYTPTGFNQTQNFASGWASFNPVIANVSYIPDSLTIGDSASLSDVTWGNAITVDGPVSVYGGNVSVTAPIVSNGSGDIWLQGNAKGASSLLVSANLTRVGATASNITLRAAGRIVDSAAITSSNAAANIIEWANYGNTSGYGVGGTGKPLPPVTFATVIVYGPPSTEAFAAWPLLLSVAVLSVWLLASVPFVVNSVPVKLKLLP